jgi:hypothetical protein
MNTTKLPITTALVLGALIAAPAARPPSRAATVFDLTTPPPAAHYSALGLSDLGQAGTGSGRRGQSNPFDATVPAAPVLHLS